MNALRGRASYLAKLNTCTLFGAVKGGYSISFSTGVEILDEDVDLDELPSKNNHSMQKQTRFSLNTSKRITNIQKQHETVDGRLTKANHKEVQLDSKSRVSDPSGGGQISDKSKASSPAHLKRNEDDPFVELDNPEITSEYRKLATELEGFWGSMKTRQSSAVSGTTLRTGEAFQKVLDSEFHTKTIPVPTTKQFATKRDPRNNMRRFDNSMRPALKFVLGDDEEVEKKKKEAVMERTTIQNPKVMERATIQNQNQKMMERTTIQNPKVMERTTIQNPKMMERATIQNQNQKMMERTTNQNQKMMEQTTNQNQKPKTIRGGEKSVCIEYVPRGIGLNDIRKAVSVYGEVVGCFLRTGDNGMLGCHLEFKTIEAKERALSNRWVYVNGKQLSVCRVDLPVTTTVRITNLGQGTAVHDVHSICMSFGNMESLQMREDGAVDVFFSVSESRNMPKLLEKLNEVTLNDSRWIAQPAPRLSHELAETPEGQKWVGQQLSKQISHMKRQLQLRRIYLEDIEELHDSLMHIKECASYVSQQYLKST